MSNPTRTADVIVNVVIQTTVGSWGEGVTIGEADSRARTLAMERVSRVLVNSHCKIVSAQAVSVYLNPEK